MRSLFLLFILSLSALPAMAGKNILAVGYNHACALKNGKVYCWGREEYVDKDRYDRYDRYSFKEIVVGNDFTCALTAGNDGAACWGPSSQFQMEFVNAELKNPRGLIAVGGYACFYDDAGIYCGGNVQKKFNFIAKKNIKKLFSWSGSFCANVKGIIECWDDDNSQGFTPTALKDVSEIQIADGRRAESFACSIIKGKLHCWNNYTQETLEVPAVSNPHSLSMSGENACVIGDDGGQCWGPSGPLKFKRPQAIVAGANGVICAIDDFTGLTCNLPIFDQMPPENLFSSFNKPLLTLEDPSIFFNTIGAASSPARINVYSAALKIIDEGITKSQVTSELAKKAAKYLVIGLLEPAVTSGDSEYYLNSAIPYYKEGLLNISKGTFRNINDVPRAPLSQKTALRVIQVSLTTMLEFLDAKDKEEIQKTIQLVGQSTISLTPQTMQSVFVALKANESIFSKLGQGTKISFLVTMIQNTSAWLNSK